MIDTTLNNIANTLLGKLPWLDVAYGKSYRLVDSENNLYPAIHINGLEYISVLPNDTLGNYLFFELEDPQQLISHTQNKFAYRFNTNLIVWFNLQSIYGTITNLVLSDSVKDTIVAALSNKYYTDLNIEIVAIFENAENIFKRYSLKQVDTQFLMLPFYGFKFSLNITEKKVC